MTTQEVIHTEDEPQLMPEHSLMELFETLTFREKWAKVFAGLKMPKDTGDYKYAKLQILRLVSPVSAVVAPVLLIVLMAMFSSTTPAPPSKVEVQVKEPEPVEELEEPPEELPPEPIQPPEPVDFEQASDMVTVTAPISVNAPATSSDFSPQPAKVDSVAITKSPVVMKGIFGSRSPGSRGQALGAYGGNSATEGAVLRTLRWLKTKQAENGSWPSDGAPPLANTALALLTYLAHGETPVSEEFGQTVEKAILYMVSQQQSDGRFPGNYEIPIAVYALAEAFAMTKVPMLRDSVERGIAVIIKGQHPSGGWDYGCAQSERDDTSYMGWCVQALKAAKMLGLSNEEDIEKALKKAIKGFEKNQTPEGGFGYTSPGNGGLTGTGVLCMQFMGQGNAKSVKNGLQLLQGATFNWDGGGNFNGLYYWYYITQAKFHAGGEHWKSWNALFSPVLVRNQKVAKGQYTDHKGKEQEIGWWEVPAAVGAHSGGMTLQTCLCALQLQVYYRYLPTFKTPQPVEQEDVAATDKDDIKIDIRI